MTYGLPWWLRQWRICLQCRRPVFNPWVGKIPWRRECLPTPVLLPGEFHGQRAIVHGFAKSRTQLSISYTHIMTYVYHFGIILNSFPALKICVLPTHPLFTQIPDTTHLLIKYLYVFKICCCFFKNQKLACKHLDAQFLLKYGEIRQ